MPQNLVFTSQSRGI